MAINLLCKKFASITPNLAYVSDAPIPGRTVKAGQRGLYNLMNPGVFGGSTEIGPQYDYELKTTVNGSYWEYSKRWEGKDGFALRKWEGPATGFSDGGHSWLTMGEYRSKALSVVKPHEELEPLEHDHPLRRLIENPNPFDTHYDLEYEKLMFRKLTGVSYEWLCPNDWGMPAERWCIPSHWVWPRTGGGRYVSPDYPHADELIQYYEVRPWGGMGSSGMLRIPPNEMIMILYKSPINKIDGYSPLHAMARWQDLEESNSQARWSQMVNMARPEMAVKLGPGYEDPDDDRIARIEAKFLAKLTGEINAGKPFILPSGAELQMLSFTPEQMLYGGTEEQIRDMLLSGHNVPPAAVGLVKEMTYGSILATLSALCSFGLNPELIQEGQAATKNLASRYDEKLPAYSNGFSLTRELSKPVCTCGDEEGFLPHKLWCPVNEWEAQGNYRYKFVTGGQGHGPSFRRVRIWYDDCVPADPQQVNNDINADQASYAITPNEVRALRGRKPYKLGGNNPIVTGPGGPMPLPLNEEEDVTGMADVIAQLSQADAKNEPEGTGQPDFSANPDEALAQSPLVDSPKPPKPPGANGKPSDDATKPPKPGAGKPKKPTGRAGEDVPPPKKPKPEDTMGKPPKQPGADKPVPAGGTNGKPKLTSSLRSGPPKKPNGPPKKSLDDETHAWLEKEGHLDFLKHGTKMLTWVKEADGDVSLAARKAADFIRLPDGVDGTNCSNCLHMADGECQFEGDLPGDGGYVDLRGLKVTERDCCAAWDADGVGRAWEKGWRHPLAVIKDWVEKGLYSISSQFVQGSGNNPQGTWSAWVIGNPEIIAQGSTRQEAENAVKRMVKDKGSIDAVRGKKDWSPTDTMGSCECGHGRDAHGGGVTGCGLCDCGDYRVVNNGVADEQLDSADTVDVELGDEVEKDGVALSTEGGRWFVDVIEGGVPRRASGPYSSREAAGEQMDAFRKELDLLPDDEKALGDTVQAAGQWLARRWESLENRYGKKQALAMAVAMIATLPLPGSIPAIVAAAEAIRGVAGWGQRLGESMGKEA